MKALIIILLTLVLCGSAESRSWLKKQKTGVKNTHEKRINKDTQKSYN